MPDDANNTYEIAPVAFTETIINLVSVYAVVYLSC